MAAEAFEPRPAPVARTSEHACDHPYLPLRSGASWSLDSPDGAMIWTVTSAGGSADSASAAMDISVAGVGLTIHWTCTTEGIVSYDFGSISSSDFGGVATLDVVDSSGVWLPAADLLVPGYSWSNDFSTVVTAAAEGTSVELTTATSESWTVIGTETVSVPAGTFEALRIDGTSTTTATMSGLPIPIPETSSNQSFWFAEGVGVVRYTSSSEGSSSNGSLTSYSIP